LNTQQSLGNNQYPKSVTEANNVLSNHKLENLAKFKKENEDSKSRQKLKRKEKRLKKKRLPYPLHKWRVNVFVAVNLSIDSQHVTLKTNQEKNGQSININRALHSPMGPQQQYPHLSLHQAIKLTKQSKHMPCITQFDLHLSQISRPFCE
jgi:hypothetical protein